MSETLIKTESGGILYDAARVDKPSDEIFTPSYWAARNALMFGAGGRGGVAFVRIADKEWVLRHYRRGGFAARISHDRYLWMGADRTRCFREWRLLARLRAMGLPAPVPVAAQYRREGLLYRADLITEKLPSTSTLAQALQNTALPLDMWRRIGATVAAFHSKGVHHADLNAHNILLGNDSVYLLDFDRGRIRSRGSWEDDVLARLKRSLLKVKSQHPKIAFGEDEWSQFMSGYGKHN